MTKEELIEGLLKIQNRELGKFGYPDCETNHEDADNLLLKYINDERVTKAFEEIEKWYA